MLKRSKHIPLHVLKGKALKVLWWDAILARLFNIKEHFSYLRSLYLSYKRTKAILINTKQLPEEIKFYLKIWPACCFKCTFY